jgi:hypothetical protein
MGANNVVAIDKFQEFYIGNDDVKAIYKKE